MMRTRTMQQKLVTAILFLTYTEAVKPPGYVESLKAPDPNPPKYSYEYRVDDNNGAEQGKEEKRDGIYAAGRYYIQEKQAKQDVRYFADDWGYHPVVEYSNVGPHSRANTKFALGHEAVQQLRNKENNLPQLQGLPETGNLQVNDPKQPQLALNRDPVETSTAGPKQPTQTSTLLEDPSTIAPQDSGEQPGVNQVIERVSDPQQQITNIQNQLQQYVSQQLDPNHSNQQPQIYTQQLQPVHYEVDGKHYLIQPDYNQNEANPSNLAQVASPTAPNQEQILVEYKEPQQQQSIFPQQQQSQSVQYQTLRNNPHSNQNILIQNQVIHTIYEPGSEAIIQPQPLLSEGNGQQEDNLNNLIRYQTFGMKIKEQNNKKQTKKLIENTKHLVTGEDVLNINSAVLSNSEDEISTVDTTTAKPCSTDPLPRETLTTFDDTTYFSTTLPPLTVTEASLQVKPIVVAEVQENHPSTTYEVKEEESFSTTVKSIESVSHIYETSSPSTIIVTPRPVSTKFLAPITAGIRLEGGSEHNIKLTEQENYNIEVQKTIPYYLGKYEFPLAYAQQYENGNNSGVMHDLELGKTILMFPGHQIPYTQKLSQKLPDVSKSQQFLSLNNRINYQQLPQTIIKDNFVDAKHQHVKYEGASQRHQSRQQATIQTHYPEKHTYKVSYPIVKQVEVPVKIERVVEKPVHITKYIEKPVPVPQPYPVEKIVEKPVHVPVQVTKYVDRPYPVEVRVPYPQPYPVEKIVQKIVKQPYPVEVRVPVQVEKIVEKKVPVPHYIEKPITVERIVEKPVPHYVDRPYPVQVAVPQPYYVQVPRLYQQTGPVNIQHKSVQQQGVKGSANLFQIPLHNEQYAQQSQQLAYIFHNPYAYAPQVNQYLPPNQNFVLHQQFALPNKPLQNNNGYLPPPISHDCQNQQSAAQTSIRNSQYSKLEDNFGLLPPKAGGGKFTRTFRNARSNFDDSSIRMEYGFKPPLIPSPEVDEQGRPVERTDNK